MTLYQLELPRVAEVLTKDVRDGTSEPDTQEYRMPFAGVEVDLEDLKNLFATAIGRELDLDRETGLDGWLAPRLHALLRLDRRQASNMGFWAWLAIDVLRPYVLYRWGPESRAGAVTEYRFIGGVTRNAIARLWWYAEIGRNGPDYKPVVAAFESAGTLQYAMELAYSRYRPAVIAFVDVANNLDSFEAKKQLSKRINAYLSLQVLEAMGLPTELDECSDAQWRKEAPPPFKDIVDGKFEGPQDGMVPTEIVDRVKAWFEEVGKGTVAGQAT